MKELEELRRKKRQITGNLAKALFTTRIVTPQYPGQTDHTVLDHNTSADEALAMVHMMWDEFPYGLELLETLSDLRLWFMKWSGRS